MFDALVLVCKVWSFLFSPRTAWYRLANVCNMHISAKRRMLPQVHMWSQKCLASALWSTHGRDQWKKVDCVYGVEEWTDLFPLPFAFLIHQVPRTRSLLGGQKQAINRYQALNQHKLNELTTHSYGFSITRMTVTSSQSRNIYSYIARCRNIIFFFFFFCHF